MKKNKPNIISNELDQAPKTWKNYRERLQDPELKEQIKNAFSYEFAVGKDSNEEISDMMVDRLGKHEKEIPLQFLVKQLSEHKKVSVLYHKKDAREKDKGATFHALIWPLVWVEHQFHKLWISFHRIGEELSNWELWTFLTFERNEYWQIVVWAEQIEIPKWPFIMEWLAAHKKLDLSEFLEYIKEEEDKQEKQKKQKSNNEVQDNATSSDKISDNWNDKRIRSRLFGKK